MPDYEFQCKDCKKVFTLHSTVEEHLKTVHPACQYCGSKNVEQLLPVVSVITGKKS